MADLFFVSVFVSLVMTFDCTKIGSEYRLVADASVICWQGFHLAQAVISGLMMIIFVSLRSPSPSPLTPTLTPTRTSPQPEHSPQPESEPSPVP